MDAGTRKGGCRKGRRGVEKRIKDARAGLGGPKKELFSSAPG
jgi:hypothetical protein